MLILTLFMLNAKKIRYIRNRKFLPVGYSSSLKEKNNYYVSIFGFIWSILKGYRFAIIVIALFGIIDTLVDFSFGPLFTKIVVKSVDTYTGPRGEIMSVLLKPLCLIIFVWFTSDVLIRCASWYYNTKLDPTIDARIKMTFLNRVSKNSYEFFTTNETGETIGCLSSVLWNIKCITKNVFRQIIPRFTACVVLLSTLVAIHWQLGTIMICYTFIYVALLVFSLKKISALKGKQMKAYARTTSNITDMLMNFSSVIFFSRKQFEFDRIKKIQTLESNRMNKSAVFLEKLKIGRSIICFTMCCLFYLCTTFYLYKNGQIDLSDMLYAMSASFESIALIGLVQEDILDIIGDMSFVKKALGVMNSGKIADENIKGGSNLNISNTSIEIKNLSFGYNNDELFNNLNISIKSGEKIGLAGRSGSGKTTLINLILKNLIPQGGTIEIGGKNIAFVSEESLKDKISVVSQDTILFNRSILDNIRYSKPNASMEEVIEVAKKANAHDFITELEYGYDTNVGERGMRLSGGQRQRILIARAMLKNAPILILDEATSALDSETEHKVSESLNRLMEGKTVIAIAHRLQTLKKMDRIIVFRDGEIVEQGTHEELLNNSNVYKSLWKIQTEGMILDD